MSQKAGARNKTVPVCAGMCSAASVRPCCGGNKGWGCHGELHRTSPLVMVIRGAAHPWSPEWTGWKGCWCSFTYPVGSGGSCCEGSRWVPVSLTNSDSVERRVRVLLQTGRRAERLPPPPQRTGSQETHMTQPSEDSRKDSPKNPGSVLSA